MLRALKLLSQRVVAVKPFMGLVACMNAEEREIIGHCFAYIELFGDEDKEFTEYLKNKIVPAITKLGHAKWGRTELTDLGFVLGNKDEIHDDISNIEELLKLGESKE